MTEGTEQTLEYAFSGVLFCMAIAMLLWMHSAFMQQAETVGSSPERVILFEREG